MYKTLDKIKGCTSSFEGAPKDKLFLHTEFHRAGELSAPQSASYKSLHMETSVFCLLLKTLEEQQDLVTFGGRCSWPHQELLSGF